MAGFSTEAAGADPLVILGTKVLNGKEKTFVFRGAIHFVFPQKIGFLVESCEYHESFLHISPSIIIVTNVEPDHLDFSEARNDIFQHFEILFIVFPEDGILIADFCNRIFVPFQKEFLGTKLI